MEEFVYANSTITAQTLTSGILYATWTNQAVGKTTATTHSYLICPAQRKTKLFHCSPQASCLAKQRDSHKPWGPGHQIKLVKVGRGELFTAEQDFEYK